MKKIVTTGFINPQTGECFKLEDVIEVKETIEVSEKNEPKDFKNANQKIYEVGGNYYHMMYNRLG